MHRFPWHSRVSSKAAIAAHAPRGNETAGEMRLLIIIA
jgi:hypothetical protein